MKRITIAALGLVLIGGAGCEDMGLDGNVPLEEAVDRPPSDLVAAIMRPTEAVTERFIVDGRLWLPSGLPLTLEQSALRAVGSAEGKTVYARHWDQAPYDALFVRLAPPDETAPLAATPLDGERWVRLEPVLGRTGPLPAGAPTGAAAPGPGH